MRKLHLKTRRLLLRTQRSLSRRWKKKLQTTTLRWETMKKKISRKRTKTRQRMMMQLQIRKMKKKKKFSSLRLSTALFAMQTSCRWSVTTLSKNSSIRSMVHARFHALRRSTWRETSVTGLRTKVSPAPASNCTVQASPRELLKSRPQEILSRIYAKIIQLSV